MYLLIYLFIYFNLIENNFNYLKLIDNKKGHKDDLWKSSAVLYKNKSPLSYSE